MVPSRVNTSSAFVSETPPLSACPFRNSWTTRKSKFSPLVLTQLKSSVIKAVASSKRLVKTMEMALRPESSISGLGVALVPAVCSCIRPSTIRLIIIDTANGIIAARRSHSVSKSPDSTRFSVIQDPNAAPEVAPMAITGNRRFPRSTV